MIAMLSFKVASIPAALHQDDTDEVLARLFSLVDMRGGCRNRWRLGPFGSLQ
jgi:hypothetical protein